MQGARMARRTKKRSKKHQISKGLGLFGWIIRGAAIGFVLGVLYAGYLAISVADQFEGRRWDVPAQVYASPLELYPGRALTADDLVAELRRLGYREDPRLGTAGTYRVGLGRVDTHLRAFDFAGDREPERLVSLSFAAGRLSSLRDSRGQPVAIARLNPLLIGSLFTAHGEDRLIVAPADIPPLLTAALKAVEDQRFDYHHGVDPIAVARALYINLTSGKIRQGASTLTQQLVRSYFLSNERTFGRKIREALMAIALELRYDKDDLLHAYVNEIYLGQDGARAVHGFGLASQFYFGKPLGELELHELALLVAEVRGPTYYDPRRHPDRARARRDFVLQRLVDEGLVDNAAAQTAAEQELGVVDEDRRGAVQAAFLGLVRRQLGMDYAREDLERKGLVVLSTLDPAAQAAAERALASGLAGFGPAGEPLEGAIVVTSPQTGEVRALVGGRRADFAGFNRALDARRPIGSLIKPAVYLAALESGRYTLGSIIDDAPIDVELDNGDVWSPRNFDDLAHGPVPLLRALAESFNMATVRLGLDVGLPEISHVLERLGLAEPPPLYPSMLLGALALTPIEVAQVYNTLANGGFRVPLKAVRSVIDENGELLQRYPIEIEQGGDPTHVYELNRALVEVMNRGTGKSLKASLPRDLVVAGKTGTSDDLRDSWFAGFSGEALVVTWLGADDNRPVGLTGSSGAAKIFARVITALEPSSFDAPMPAALEERWIDYATGEPVAPRCTNAVAIPVPETAAEPRAFGCDGETGFGSRVRSWFRSNR
jgi:penicillin-binding protein 1B